MIGKVIFTTFLATSANILDAQKFNVKSNFKL